MPAMSQFWQIEDAVREMCLHLFFTNTRYQDLRALALTSKRASRPALRLLWRTLPLVKAVLALLGCTVATANQLDFDLLTDDQVERYLQYCGWVHEFHVELPSDGPQIRPAIWRRMAYPRDKRPAFPNLSRLSWVARNFKGLKVFMGHIEELVLGMPPEYENASAKPTVRPVIQALPISANLHTLTIPKCATGEWWHMLKACDRIHTLHLTWHALCASIELRKLWRMPTLRTVHCNDVDREWQDISVVARFRDTGDHTLQSLELDGNWRSICVLVAKLPRGGLELLRLRFRSRVEWGYEEPSCYSDFMQLVTDRFQESLQAVALQQCDPFDLLDEEADDMPNCQELMAPITRLSELHSLRIQLHAVTGSPLTGDQLQELLPHWPHLECFSLLCPSGKTEFTGVTLGVLSTLCPSLREVAIDLLVPEGWWMELPSPPLGTAVAAGLKVIQLHPLSDGNETDDVPVSASNVTEEALRMVAALIPLFPSVQLVEYRANGRSWDLVKDGEDAKSMAHRRLVEEGFERATRDEVGNEWEVWTVRGRLLSPIERVQRRLLVDL